MEEARIGCNWEHIWHYRQMGFYFAQLRRYYSCFSRTQIRVYLYDTLQREPLSVIADILQFLGVDPTFSPDVSIRHNEPGIPPAQRPLLIPRGAAAPAGGVSRRHLKASRADSNRPARLVGVDLRRNR